jgi:hypothetical protein
MMGRPRKYDYDAIVRDHLAGMTAADIMRAHGVSRVTVSRALIPAVGKRQATPAKVPREEFRRLLDELGTVAAVSRTIGCHWWPAQRRAERMGLRI